MSNAVVAEAFGKAAQLALEDWAMMMLEQAESSPTLFSGDGAVFMGTMQFKGLTSGTIAVLCQEPFLRALCCNVLGANSPDEVSNEECKDALKELTNVLTGRFLTEAYGEEAVFDLIYPTAYEADKSLIHKFFQMRTRYCYVADSEPVAMAIGPIGLM